MKRQMVAALDKDRDEDPPKVPWGKTCHTTAWLILLQKTHVASS